MLSPDIIKQLAQELHASEQHEFAVQRSRTNLNELMSAFVCPEHLMLLRYSVTHQQVDG